MPLIIRLKKHEKVVIKGEIFSVTHIYDKFSFRICKLSQKKSYCVCGGIYTPLFQNVKVTAGKAKTKKQVALVFQSDEKIPISRLPNAPH